MKFELHFVQTFSNEKIAYISIADIDELNKLGIQNFLIWDNLGLRKLVCRCWNLKIANLNHLTFSNGKLTKTTIVYLDELNKLGIQNFSIWDNLGFRKIVCRRRNLKIIIWTIQTISNGKLTKTTIVDLDEFNKLWCSKLFNLKSFRVHNTRVKLLFFHLTKFDLVKLAQMRH